MSSGVRSEEDFIVLTRLRLTKVLAAFLIPITLLVPADAAADPAGPWDSEHASADTVSTAIQSRLSLFRPPPDSAEVAKLIEAADAKADTHIQF